MFERVYTKLQCLSPAVTPLARKHRSFAPALRPDPLDFSHTTSSWARLRWSNCASPFEEANSTSVSAGVAAPAAFVANYAAARMNFCRLVCSGW